MKTIKNSVGNEIKVFAETFEFEAYDQIKALGNFEPYLQSKIRVMPDAHAGKGCVVGTTMTITDKVTPNLVGVDIGCGMFVVKLKEKGIDLVALDQVIKEKVPSGFNIHKKRQCKFDLDRLKCVNSVDLERAALSIGSLGGGNHFIEIDRAADDTLYLVIHSGSRHLGVQVCKYYQDKAFQLANEVGTAKVALIQQLKGEGREKEIDSALKQFRKPQVNKELAFVYGKDFDDYIHDMREAQEYATMNRRVIADIILSGLRLQEEDSFTTIHNYIDIKEMILRKGAVSAKAGEMLIIPMNMRDGSLICKGKGNPDWNFSAPHGAGRLMSRSKAKERISFKEFTRSMKGIYTTSVNRSTIDEAPQAYKSMEEIVRLISDTVEIVDIIKPIYNFKAN